MASFRSFHQGVNVFSFGLEVVIMLKLFVLHVLLINQSNINLCHGFQVSRNTNTNINFEREKKKLYHFNTGMVTASMNSDRFTELWKNQNHHHFITRMNSNGFSSATRIKNNEVSMALSTVTTIGKHVQSLAISAFIIFGTMSFQPLSSVAALTSNSEKTPSFTPITGIIQTSSQTTSSVDSTGIGTTSTLINPIKNNRSRYWSIINSNDHDEIIKANEKLMDYAVGTINTMYYDNSGGAFFSPKDFYDRWKVLRVYAKDGIGGVKDMVGATVTATDIGKGDGLGGKQKVLKKGMDYKNSENNNDSEEIMFKPQLFIVDGEKVKVKMDHWGKSEIRDDNISILPPHAFDSRDDVVQSLKWLVGTLDDPYSKYLTRDELQQELNGRDDGFLGLGVIVEGPKDKDSSKILPLVINTSTTSTASSSKSFQKESNDSTLLTSTAVSNLPIVTAVSPNSPGERVGIVVGDRVAAVGSDSFVGLKRSDVMKKFLYQYTGAENYFGNPEVTIAKPIYKVSIDQNVDDEVFIDGGRKENGIRRDELMGYKVSRVRLTTISLQSGIVSRDGSSIIPDIVPHASAASPTNTNNSNYNEKKVVGGDSIVQWELLTPNESIFNKFSSFDENQNIKFRSTDRVGYIRLTRFSRLSTAGYVNAIEELEKLGAQSYIIDVRNNYGGVIQESMLTASTLLRDPHTVLCYTLNSRGGFTPHDAEEYIVDTRYPGYLLSSESRDVTMQQVKRDSPNFVSGDGWIPPSAYASIREQRMNRGISRTSFNLFGEKFREVQMPVKELKKLRAQKKIVILMNEGTGTFKCVYIPIYIVSTFIFIYM
jgi:C-terminal processing protease CtpA/Prc